MTNTEMNVIRVTYEDNKAVYIGYFTCELSSEDIESFVKNEAPFNNDCKITNVSMMTFDIEESISGQEAELRTIIRVDKANGEQFYNGAFKGRVSQDDVHSFIDERYDDCEDAIVNMIVLDHMG